MLLVGGILSALGAGLVWPFFNYIFSGILALMMSPLENNDELNMYCLYMFLVAILAGTFTMLYSFAFGLTS
jgi:uncharacterized membrane protein